MKKTKIYRFTEKCVSFAKKVVDNPKETAIPENGGKYAKWALITLHCIRLYTENTYRETIDHLYEMPRILKLIGLNRHTLPHYSTLCKSFDRIKANICRKLLNISKENNGHTAIDSSGFQKHSVSHHYANRVNYKFKSLKTTLLIDIKSKTILDVHITTSKKHDTQIGEQVIKRNIDKITSIAADKGYDWQHLRDKLRENNVRPLIKHRLFKKHDHAHNARIDDKIYNKRTVCESIFWSIKSTLGDSVSARFWYRQFREIILECFVHNTKRLTNANSTSF